MSLITSHVLAHLKGLTKLQTLSLDPSQITDAGLTRLHLAETPATDAGVADLQQALPNGKIERSTSAPRRKRE
ncbi:MAG: hypothetical protein CMJ59_02225 [Planctomycetaceae bacterium]|nr:hypothetical protein [Planctomycetaceae bacterium]